MARKGPPRKPTELLKLHGSWLAKTRTGEPKPAPQDEGRPTRPTYLAKHKHAVKLWDYNIPRLERMGVLTQVDRDAFARYCVLLSMFIEASDFVAKHGPILDTQKVTQNGIETTIKDHPAVSRMLRLDQQLQRLGSRFGMTAADRAGMAQTAGVRKQKKTDLELKESKYFGT